MTIEETIFNIFEQLPTIYPSPSQRVYKLIEMFNNAGYDPTIRMLITTDESQMNSFLRIVILCYIGYTVPYVSFQSSTDAMTLLNTLQVMFEAQYTDPLMDGNAFGMLMTLISKISNDISTRGIELPSIQTFTIDPNSPISTPVISQYLYRTGLRSDEIILRNNDSIVNPLFCTLSLEVLSS